MKKEYWIVTSCTPQYLPGLVALRNSIEMLFPEASLGCYYYDQGTKLELPERITYIHNAEMLGPIVNSGGAFRQGLKLGPDMYSRLLIPNYFPGKVFYVDADCVLIDSIKEAWDLDLEGSATACVYRPDRGWEGGHIFDDMGSGTYLCDTDVWRERNYVQGMFDLMKDINEGKVSRKFSVNVESVLSHYHQGEFLKLSKSYQNLAYYGTLCKQDKIVHWGGPKPWSIQGRKPDGVANYVDLWEGFYNQEYNNIKILLDKLPEEDNTVVTRFKKVTGKRIL